jgi:hypothetical protein
MYSQGYTSANTEQGKAGLKFILNQTFHIKLIAFLLIPHRDPTKASAFIVPFDAGVHSYIDHRTGKPRLASPHGWYAIQLLKNAAQDKVREIN